MYRKVKQGVPQGGVLSPALFNFYMANLPTSTDDAVKIISYTDDITILCNNTSSTVASTKINSYLVELSTWLRNKFLCLSPSKSTSTLFTSWNREIYDVLNIKVQLSTTPLPFGPLRLAQQHGQSFKQHKMQP